MQPARSSQNVFMVGLGHIKVTQEQGAVVKAIGLGSCVGVIAISPRYRAVGMVHVVLPDSKIDEERAAATPGYFADTAIQKLFDEFRKLGVHNHRDLMIKLAGGARIMAANHSFDIGKRNILGCRKALWSRGLAPLAEDVGGSHSRTVWVAADDGRVRIESPGKGRWEL